MSATTLPAPPTAALAAAVTSAITSAVTSWPAKLARIPVTAASVTVLLGAYGWLAFAVSDPTPIERWASTNIVNLRHHPVSSLLASAFVNAGGLPITIGILAVAFAVLERRIGARLMLLVALTGHVVASLVTEAAVRLAIVADRDPRSSAWQLDVGISYVTYTAVGAALAFLPSRWRRAGVAVVAAYLMLGLVQSPDMTAWGHLLSLAIGIFSWPLLTRVGSADARRRVQVLTSLGAAGTVALLIPR